MTASTLYLVLSLVVAVLTLAAAAPRLFGPYLSAPMSVLAMGVVFFTPQALLLGVVLTAWAASAGAFQHPAGQVGLVLHLVCWSAMALYLWAVHRALPVLDGVPVRDVDQPFDPGPPGLPAQPVARGVVSWTPSLIHRIPAMLAVEVERGVVFREVGRLRLALDVYRPKQANGPTPSLVYIHGGGWFSGTRRQSRFMLYELAAAGWTVFAISYRFAPRFPLPAAIEDCKAAIAWVRAHAAKYGARGDTIVVVGGSAGGHLAAMLALTPHLRRFQPGFEEADTCVQGAVILYGVSDLTGAFGERPHPGMALFLERVVFRRRYRDDPELFRAATPVSYCSAEAPPILLVHGTHDEVVPIGESRLFAARLRQAGAPSVHLLEVPLGNHAFEVFPTPLHQRAVRVIARFLDTLRPTSEASS
jgi:acetyl esterase/lipase